MVFFDHQKHENGEGEYWTRLISKNRILPKTIKVVKGTILLKPDQICKVGYKVISGCLKSYVINSSGKEHIIQFGPEAWLISDMESFTHGTKSKIFIDAVEDSELEILDKHHFPEFEEMGKEMLLGVSLKLRNNLIATKNRLSRAANSQYEIAQRIANIEACHNSTILIRSHHKYQIFVRVTHGQ